MLTKKSLLNKPHYGNSSPDIRKKAALLNKGDNVKNLPSKECPLI